MHSWSKVQHTQCHFWNIHCNNLHLQAEHKPHGHWNQENHGYPWSNQASRWLVLKLTYTHKYTYNHHTSISCCQRTYLDFFVDFFNRCLKSSCSISNWTPTLVFLCHKRVYHAFNSTQARANIRANLQPFWLFWKTPVVGKSCHISLCTNTFFL